MLYKIEAESFDGNEAVDRSKGNVSKAEDTIEAAQKEINVSDKPFTFNVTIKLHNTLNIEIIHFINFVYYKIPYSRINKLLILSRSKTE